MKALVAVVLASVVALSGCEPSSPYEREMRDRTLSNYYTGYIKENSYEVCVGGMKAFYFSNGNASQIVTKFDTKTGKVVPCEEAE